MKTSTAEQEAGEKKEKEKRFQCTSCSRMFARLEHLQRHERIREWLVDVLCLLLTHPRQWSQAL
jgi:transposase-like protein